jgi:hypothetical protein
LDWPEQRHHVSGGLGRCLLERLTELGWIRSSRSTPAVEITDAGSEGLRDTFDIDLTPAPPNLPIQTTSSRIR